MIKARQLVKEYGKGPVAVAALNGVNLDVERGQFVAITGPSGSGKSTLMNILGCLDVPTSGEYYLNGMNTSLLGGVQLAYLRNRTIGFVFQSFFLLPRLTAAENMEIPLLYAGVTPVQRKKMVAEMLERMGLSDRTTHLPNELSGGQRQRVAIGRALINKPLLILADEPTGNLDTKTGREIMSLLSELNKAGTTIVLITHEREIASYAQRLLALKDGLFEADLQIATGGRP
ncbi:MAG: ABC transporter ATP-binding protein [Bacillota bacterium]|nr:ABC transporter ATP-binding protein [Bacillota bacterium]